ncbi:XVIPCD domain-containing protein [Stenotrophomonas sp. PS02289]|uniref:Smlt3024 family type IV secretion system effector n=1 Tax=Stenotrophomonas sp. PS02289 TaxID=2991422 RepID=UPI00249CEB26|nr:XVIPCD domain-containing protein [Stenotrophomonas sp. PS02289]
MNGLTDSNLRILASYANSGNRELYWNYLSQLPGADGYGTLALGVVRNDNLPGQVANTYAQGYASTQHDRGSRFENKEPTERGWEEFGQTLLLEDLERRRYWIREGRPELALNLPGEDVMLAHDKAFELHKLDPNCWTPRVLLQAAQENSGPQKMEEIWRNMLVNDNLGVNRMWNTGIDSFVEKGAWQGGSYLVKLGVMEAGQLTNSRNSVDPNVIGSHNKYSRYFEETGTWVNYRTAGRDVFQEQEKDPARIAELNDARAVRLERQEMSTQFHEEDNFRTITPSPKTGSIDDVPGKDQPITRLADIGPGHPEYQLMQQVREQVAALDAKQGRSFDEFSERMTASVMALARENNLDRADHVVLSVATAEHGPGRNVFVVQGDLNDPAHRRAVMPTQDAVQTPVEQSLQRLEVASADRQQALAQSQQQEVDQQARENPAIRMG